MSEKMNNGEVPQRRGKKKKSNKIKGQEHSRPVGKHRKLKTGIRLAIYAIIAIMVLTVIYSAVVIIKAPKIDPNHLYDNLSESSIFYDDNGKEIGSVYAGDDGNRQNVEYDQIPEDMINAIVAIEDKTFWKHHGFNVIRIFGAIKDSVFGGGQISGTSTLTQQLARNIYLTNERSMSRKIKEAYYTICLERQLTKEQIVEAYLNTINLGYGCYGIQSASQAYFSKDVSDLTLFECAALAAIPQSPTTNALVLRYEKGSVSSDDKNIISTDNEWIYYYNGNASKARRNTVLNFMCEQGYITEEQRDKALKKGLKKRIKLSHSSKGTFASYFTDYALSEVISDLQTQEDMTEAQAKELVYNGGLKIYTTLDSKAQEIAETEYANTANFPGTANLRMDGNGNIVNNGVITLYSYNNFFDSEGNFTLRPAEFKWKDDGSLILKKNHRLNFYEVQSGDSMDINIEFKNMYSRENGYFYSVEGGVISIDKKYKSLTEKGSVIISKEFFADNPDFFTKSGENLLIGAASYTLRQKINQPQSAMVIIDNASGQIKTMIGGRGSSGRMLYNRAISPRQPGSSIKPLAVYSAALQQGADADGSMDFAYSFEKTKNHSSYGKCWTANSYINDEAMQVNGQTWPKNWYNGHRGYMTLRKSVEQSVNVNAVKVFSEVGPEYSISQLKKFGITSVVEEGDVNDQNAAALALGGMTKGVSPLEMAGAYAALANLGTYNEPTSYVEVLNRDGDVILKSKSEQTKVLDKGVAWIMDDILRTTVTNGIASGAAIGVQPVAGKTGTTTDNFDAWFCGFTPQYTAALWIGNDVNIELTEGSASAARLWSKIMRQVCSKFPNSGFIARPSNVVQSGGEYFIEGTVQHIAKPKSEKDLKKEAAEKKKKVAAEKKKKESEKKEGEEIYPPGTEPDESNKDAEESDSKTEE